MRKPRITYLVEGKGKESLLYRAEDSEAVTTFSKETIDVNIIDIQKGDFKVLHDNVSYNVKPGSKEFLEDIMNDSLKCTVCDKKATMIKHVIFRVDGEIDASYLVAPYCSNDCRMYRVFQETP